MKTSTANLKKVLLDLASVDAAVLNVTPKAQTALKGKKLDQAERTLLERVDGFRSLEQILAMSSDLTSVHAILGQLMVSGYVISDSPDEESADETFDVTPVAPLPAAVKAPPVKQTKAAPTLALEVDEIKPVEADEENHEGGPDEVERAKQLLLKETRRLLGPGAEKLRPRIEASRSVAEVFDLIVKVRVHLTKTGKADPDIFLEQLITGLAAARKKPAAGLGRKRS